MHILTKQELSFKCIGMQKYNWHVLKWVFTYKEVLSHWRACQCSARALQWHYNGIGTLSGAIPMLRGKPGIPMPYNALQCQKEISDNVSGMIRFFSFYSPLTNPLTVPLTNLLTELAALQLLTPHFTSRYISSITT